VLIALGVERLGTMHASWSNWLPMAVSTLIQRTIAIVIFAAVLAFVVQLVRKVLIGRARRADPAAQG
jgi:hypothetical protein